MKLVQIANTITFLLYESQVKQRRTATVSGDSWTVVVYFSTFAVFLNQIILYPLLLVCVRVCVSVFQITCNEIMRHRYA